MKLSHNKLCIRSANPEDATTLAKWWSDGAVMAHAGFPLGLQVDVSALHKRLSNQKSTPMEGNHLCIVEYFHQPIGEMNIRLQHDEAEIGIKICETKHQNQGLGTLALKCLISYLFDQQRVERIVLDTNLQNKRAQHVYESLGFESKGIRYQAFLNQLDEPQDAIDYVLKKSTYQEISWRKTFMTKHDILNMEIQYVSMFSAIELKPYGYLAQDASQRDKYYHNYLHILDLEQCNQEDLEQYAQSTKQYGHINFRFEEEPIPFIDFLKGYQPSRNGYYWANINDLVIPMKQTPTIQRIDPSVEEEFKHYLYLENREYGEQFAKNNSIRQWNVLMKEQSYTYFYALHEGHMAGSINVTWTQTEAKIDDFTVLEHMRNKGLGSALMAHAITFLKRQGVTRVYLVTDLDDTPRQMYEKWGFEYVSCCYHYIKEIPSQSVK